MKKLALAVLALLAVGLVAGCSSATATGQKLDAATYLTKVAEPGIVVIDVRSPAEYAQGHLDGAVNIDVEAAGFADQIATLDPSGTYAVYCHSGRRSAIAAEQMAAAGFTTVYDLDGGLAELAAAGAPVVTS